jgi:hypothetical protein
MPHPCDHPAVALAITRGLPGQMQKAKANGDHAAAQAIEAALIRARRIARPLEQARATTPPEPQPIPPHPRPPQPPHPNPSPKPPPPPRPPVQHGREDGEGWAEIVVDRRRRHWR